MSNNALKCYRYFLVSQRALALARKKGKFILALTCTFWPDRRCITAQRKYTCARPGFPAGALFCFSLFLVHSPVQSARVWTERTSIVIPAKVFDEGANNCIVSPARVDDPLPLRRTIFHMFISLNCIKGILSKIIMRRSRTRHTQILSGVHFYYFCLTNWKGGSGVMIIGNIPISRICT